MFPVRYIHAADLHLDAAFKGLRRQSGSLQGSLGDVLASATFTALDRLVTLCEREKPDFLVLAGDIYNEDDHSLKAQLALRDACARLQKLSIAVFIVHGNHDPLSSRLKMIQWPENTTIFSGEMEHHAVYARPEALEKNPALSASQPLAVVHGISHTSAREGRNLAKAFSRLEGEHASVFQLGLLHCSVESAPQADRYAPCTLEDLQQTGLDAWALGHIHQRCILSQKPFVAYSGNTQGLHINENHGRGCLLVTVQPELSASGQGFEISEEFHELGPVVWEKVDISLEGVEQITQVEELIQEALENVASSASAQSLALMVRVCLQGHTVLDGELRYQDFCAELCRRMQAQGTEHISAQSPQVGGELVVWLKDIVVETSPLLAMEELLKRDDLLGETLRFGQQLQEDSKDGHDFVQSTLSPLYGHTRAKAVLVRPEQEEVAKLLEDAARLCVDVMESR